MIDPLAQVVALLRPGVRFTKVVGAAGRWGVRRMETGQPSYCVVLDGACLLTVAGMDAMPLAPGDFVLIPAAYEFSMSSLRPPPARDFDKLPVHIAPGEVRHGTLDGPPDVRFLIGHCVFESTDAALLVSLLPRVVHVRGAERLATLVHLVNDESRAQRPARDVVLARLLEVLLIEALRDAADSGASPGLVRGLADARLAHALRALHEAPARAWTVADLARGRPVALRILRAFQPHGRHGADGLPADVADGARARLAAARGRQHRRGGRACGVQFGEHVYRCLYAPCGGGAGALCAGRSGGVPRVKCRAGWTVMKTKYITALAHALPGD